MEGARRARFVALAVLVAALVPLVAIAVSSGGDDPDPGGLRVERTPGAREIVVYVEDLEANRAETAGGAARVTLDCVDQDGGVIWISREAWPFRDTDNGTLDPHVHLVMEPARLDRIERCRLRDTDPPLEGRLL